MNCYANMIMSKSLVLVMLSFRISSLCSHDVEFIIVPCPCFGEGTLAPRPRFGLVFFFCANSCTVCDF
jgi:hypothetical protein